MSTRTIPTDGFSLTLDNDPPRQFVRSTAAGIMRRENIQVAYNVDTKIWYSLEEIETSLMGKPYNVRVKRTDLEILVQELNSMVSEVEDGLEDGTYDDPIPEELRQALANVSKLL